MSSIRERVANKELTPYQEKLFIEYYSMGLGPNWMAIKFRVPSGLLYRKIDELGLPKRNQAEALALMNKNGLLREQFIKRIK